MSSLSQWGPSTWALLHTLAEKIKDDRYTAIGAQLFHFIIQICCNLPCPDCTTHAKMFLSKVSPTALRTKNDMKTLLYVFHNAVNKRKNLPLFQFDQLDTTYKSKNLINVYNEFIRNYHTRGNMKLLSESFHRSQVVKQFRVWFMHNIQSFHLD